MKQIKGSLTQASCDLAKQGNPKACAIALQIKEQNPEVQSVTVGEETIRVRVDDVAYTFRTTKALKVFIHKFDRGIPIDAPTSYQLNLKSAEAKPVVKMTEADRERLRRTNAARSADRAKDNARSAEMRDIKRRVS